MSWEQHRYAVERARDRMKERADAINEEKQMVTLQGEAAGGDAELLDDVAEFLQSLEGSKAGQILENPGEAFIADWNRMVGTISVLCGQYDLPKPEMVFHPKVLSLMRSISNSRIADTIIFAGVKIRFGKFEQADVLRQI